MFYEISIFHLPRLNTTNNKQHGFIKWFVCLSGFSVESRKTDVCLLCFLIYSNKHLNNSMRFSLWFVITLPYCTEKLKRYTGKQGYKSLKRSVTKTRHDDESSVCILNFIWIYCNLRQKHHKCQARSRKQNLIHTGSKFCASLPNRRCNNRSWCRELTESACEKCTLFCLTLAVIISSACHALLAR